MFIRKITITQNGSLAAEQIKYQNIQSNADEAPTVANELPNNSQSYTLLLPYTGQKDEQLIRSLKKDMHGKSYEKVQTRICYTGTKTGTKFNNVKDPIKNAP